MAKKLVSMGLAIGAWFAFVKCGSPKQMTLRIQRSVERSSVVFILTGRIEGGQVPDLEAFLRSESSEHAIVLELGGVKLVDRDAVQFLANREAAGTELRNCSAYIREWIAQEKNAKQRSKIENTAGLKG